MSVPRDAYTDPLQLSKEGDKDPAQAFFEAQAREKFDELMNTVQTFGTAAGKKELARLRKETIEAGTWSPMLAQQYGLDVANATAYAREGQAALVRDIENRIKLAEKVKTPDDLFDLMKGEN